METATYENPTNALRFSGGEDHFEKLINTSIDLMCTINAEGHFVQVSKSSEDIWGYTPAEMIGQPLLQFVYGPDRNNTGVFTKKLAWGSSEPHFENRLLHKNGTLVPTLWFATWDAQEALYYCVARDLTGIKKAEHELKEKTTALQKVMGMAKMGTWEYDPLSGTTLWSPELYGIYGIDQHTPKEELVPLFLQHVYPDDLDRVRQVLLTKECVGGSLTHRFVRPDKKLIYLKHTTSPLLTESGHPGKLAGITQDVTDAVGHDEALRTRERRFKALVQSSLDIVGIIDLAGNYTYVSDNVKPLLGFDPEHFLDKNAFDFIHPDDAGRVYGHLAAIALEKYTEVKPFRFKNAAGEWRWIETRVNNMIDDPAIEGLVVNSRDVTDKKQIQDKIGELSKIAEQTENAVVITDKEGRITWVNTAFEKISGYHAPDVIGKKPGSFLQGPGSDLAVIATMRQAIQKGEGFDVEIINYTQKGEPYWIHMQCQPQLDETNNLCGFFAIQTNITERKRLEHELQNEVTQRQKRITSAILHAQEKERSELSKELHDNVNQILTTVKLYLEMAQDGKENAAILVQKAKEYVLKSIDEIRQITKRLAAPDKVDINLSEAVKDLVDTIALSGKIKIEYTHYGLDRCHPSEEVSLAIFRVAQEHLTNIVKHAEATKVQISLSVIAGNLSLLVIDNGKGFDVSKKRRGIGLNNMYNRVETFNGRLNIKSKIGEGCTLMAVIPSLPAND